MVPSSTTLSPLAASVVPVVVMSTISSAVPAAGAPFGGAEAFDDAVVDHAVLGEEAAREVHVFGGDPHAAVACRRNAVATSSRSAMLRTSIQACGTATTTLA